MAITTHTTMVITTLFDELFFLCSGAEVELDTIPVEDVVNVGTYKMGACKIRGHSVVFVS